MWVRELPDRDLVVIEQPQPFWVGAVRHSSQVFSLWTDEERAAIGIYPASVDVSGDGKFKRRTGNLQTWDKTKVGGAYVITPAYENVPRAEVVALIKEKGRRRVLFELLERSNNSWVSYKDAVRTRGQELVQAFDAGQPIDIESGSANGAGSWPA